jgi:hypothetical protein
MTTSFEDYFQDEFNLSASYFEVTIPECSSPEKSTWIGGRDHACLTVVEARSASAWNVAS